jgi:ABC-type dipeptide/oligopeptide/nickel transport system permease component
MGELLIGAISDYDYTLLTGIVVFTTIIFIGVNLFVDVLYGILDPRIRY